MAQFDCFEGYFSYNEYFDVHRNFTFAFYLGRFDIFDLFI